MAARRSDPVAMLKKDHQNVKKLLNQLVKASEGNQRRRLFEEIRQEITVHSRLEEELFYPAFRDAAKTEKDRDLFHESHEEHALVDHLLGTMEEAEWESDEFGAKARVLRELVQEHIKEEETAMLPRTKRYLEADELRDLGDRMQARRAEFMTEASRPSRVRGREEEPAEAAA